VGSCRVGGLSPAQIAGKADGHPGLTCRQLSPPGAGGLRLAMAIWFEGQKAPLRSWIPTQQAHTARGPRRRGKTRIPTNSAWPNAVVLVPDGLPWGSVRKLKCAHRGTAPRGAATTSATTPFQNILGRPIRDQVKHVPSYPLRTC
jgi:hypothetical protein